MSSERLSSNAACRSLGEYIEALVERLGESNAAALARLRNVVDGRRARIDLDAEAVEVAFTQAGELIVETVPSGARVDGEGATDTATVLALLDGHLEVNDAILDGRLRVTGHVDAVVCIFVAIEILLDASSRSVGLQALAREFRIDPCREATGQLRPRLAGMRRQAATWGPEFEDAHEVDLLRRLDLRP
jgi:hypothetical protein